MYFDFKIFTDGASKGNPGLSCSGFIVYDNKTNEKIYEYAEVIGNNETNNTAEWYAFYLVCTYLADILIKFPSAKIYASIFSDSMLVVNQFYGKYQIRNERIKNIAEASCKIIQENKDNITLSVSHIKRDKNKEADKLVNKFLKKYIQSNRHKGSDAFEPCDIQTMGF